MIELQPALDAGEVATLLRCSKSRVYELWRLGILPHFSMGRQKRMTREQLVDFIRRGGNQLSVNEQPDL